MTDETGWRLTRIAVFGRHGVLAEEAGATTDGCASCPAATDRRIRPPSGIKDC